MTVATFDDVVGQSAAARGLRETLAADRLGHALLLVGPRGVGQEDLVAALAAGLNCPDAADGQGCGTCPTCTRITNGTHASIVVQEPPGAWYLVENVREDWIPVASRTISEGRRRVMFVREADRMNEAAQNAFLKALEEPGPSTIWVLEAVTVDPLLDTILSRCRRVDVNSWTPSDLEFLVRRLGFKSDEIRIVARAAQGSPARLREYLHRECPDCGTCYEFDTALDVPDRTHCTNERCPSVKKAEEVAAKGEEPDPEAGLLVRDLARTRHLSVIARLRENGPIAVGRIAEEVVEWSKARPAALHERHDEEKRHAAIDGGVDHYRDLSSSVRRPIELRQKRESRRARLEAINRFLEEFGLHLRDLVAVSSGGDPADVVNLDADHLAEDAAAVPVPTALAALAEIPAIQEAVVVNSAQPQLQLERLLLPVAVAVFASTRAA